MNSLFKNRSIRSKMQSYQDALSCSLNPHDFEDDDDDEAMEWCLFGEDLEEATDQNTSVHEPQDLLALLQNAIRAIEQGNANEDQDAANALPNLLAFLLETAELIQRGERAIAADLGVHGEFAKPLDSGRSWSGLGYREPPVAVRSGRSWSGLGYTEPPAAGRSWRDVEYHALPEFVNGFCDTWKKDGSFVESAPAVRPSEMHWPCSV